MKILWLVHIILPQIADSMGCEAQSIGGWLVKLSQQLARTDGIELTVVFPQHLSTNVLEGTTVDNCHYFGFPAKKKEATKYNWHEAVNIHRLKDVLTAVSSFLYSLWCIPKYHIDKLMVDVLAAPAALGGLCAACLWRKKVIGIVTDIPDILFSHGDKAYHLVSNYIIKRVNGYVFLTQQMNVFLKNENKPYVIIEGLVDCELEEDKPRTIHEGDKRIILYSGTIHKQYGIKALTEGFIDANLDHVELHIYGAGDYQEELQELCKKHLNIKFFGCVLNSEMVSLQKQATILVNPRSPEEEFTKYSFPSKNMEYLLSGIPVMAALLPGMPEEYRDYMYTIEDCSREGICRALQKVLSKTSDELQEMGRRARQFVLNEKNKNVQAKKVRELLDKESGI